MEPEKIFTEAEILARYETLPADVKAAVYSANMTQVLQNIGKKYQLHIDQVSTLVQYTGLVMLGLTKRDEFITKLAPALRLPEEITKKVVEEINVELFGPIRESLKKIHGEGTTPSQPLPNPVKETLSRPMAQAVSSTRSDLVHPQPVVQTFTPKPATPITSVTPPRQALAEAIAGLASKTPSPSTSPAQTPPIHPAPTQVARPVAPQSTPSPSLPPVSHPVAPAMPLNIAAARLSGIVRSPLQETVLKPSDGKSIEKPIEPSKPRVDPYREPTN